MYITKNTNEKNSFLMAAFKQEEMRQSVMNGLDIEDIKRVEDEVEIVELLQMPEKEE